MPQPVQLAVNAGAVESFVFLDTADLPPVALVCLAF
jgi:hypothetical protein